MMDEAEYEGKSVVYPTPSPTQKVVNDVDGQHVLCAEWNSGVFSVNLHNCPNCGTKGVLIMDDGRCPHCRKPFDMPADGQTSALRTNTPTPADSVQGESGEYPPTPVDQRNIRNTGSVPRVSQVCFRCGRSRNVNRYPFVIARKRGEMTYGWSSGATSGYTTVTEYEYDSETDIFVCRRCVLVTHLLCLAIAVGFIMFCFSVNIIVALSPSLSENAFVGIPALITALFGLGAAAFLIVLPVLQDIGEMRAWFLAERICKDHDEESSAFSLSRWEEMSGRRAKLSTIWSGIRVGTSLILCLAVWACSFYVCMWGVGYIS